MPSKNIYQPYRPVWITAVTVCLVIAGMVAVSRSDLNADARKIFFDWISFICNIAATLALVIAAQKSRRISTRLALGWAVLAVAQSCMTLGDFVWAYDELILGITPFPSIADAFYLLYYPVFLAGVLIFPAVNYSRIEWWKRTLDLGIVLVAAILGVWVYLLVPLLEAGVGMPLLNQVLSIAYPAGDLVVFYALLLILYTRFDKYPLFSTWLIGLSATLMIFSDCVFSYQSLVGTYEAGGLLDVGWIASYLILVLASVVQICAVWAHRTENTIPPRVMQLREKFSSLLSYSPYLWIIGAYFLLVESSHLDAEIDFVIVSIGVGLILCMVIVRQLIALREVSRLFTNLRSALRQVELKASELDASNQKLQLEIREREQAEQRLFHDALYDSLTGLPNRALFMDRLEHALECAKRGQDSTYSVLFLDLDHFKVINDSQGHTTGDNLLIEIGKRLKSCIRSIDTIARFGGDEFVILLEDVTDEKMAVTVSNRIISMLQQPILYRDQEIYVTCSIGIIPRINEFTNPEDILRDADAAMYWAKSSGRAEYKIFTESLRIKAKSRMDIENDLRRAIANQEFVLDYQPIYSLISNRIVGFEALIRWRHPVRGLLPPSEFIRVAEETGLIVPIGDWVMYEACAQVMRWQNRFQAMGDLAINVNISGKQLQRKDFVEKVKAVVLATGIHPSQLNLEITENVMIDHQNLVQNIFTSLSGFGVKLQIDDFGTGYSSLAYLQHYPVNTIKIDRSFVEEMIKSKKGYELIRTIIDMARELGMDTIAEGIENDDQLVGLKSLMCPFGQGYLLARPVSGSSANHLLKQQLEKRQTLIARDEPANALFD